MNLVKVLDPLDIKPPLDPELHALLVYCLGFWVNGFGRMMDSIAEGGDTEHCIKPRTPGTKGKGGYRTLHQTQNPWH